MEDKTPHATSQPTAFAHTLRSGITVAGLAYGEPRAGRPSIVSLHGWLDNAASFDGLGPQLASRGEHLIAIDLPGHGRSEHLPPSASRNFVDWLPIVEDILEALRLERVRMVSHSMGSAISLLYAGVRPERVERLVMLEGLGPMTRPAERVVEQLRSGLDSRARAYGRDAKTFASLDEVVELMLSARMPMARASARAIGMRNTEEDAQGRLRFAYDPMLQTSSLLRFTEPQLLAILAEITCSALFVRASEGWPVDDDTVTRRLAPIKDVTVVEVEGTHHVHLDAPERVTPHLATFLGEA